MVTIYEKKIAERKRILTGFIASCSMECGFSLCSTTSVITFTTDANRLSMLALEESEHA